MSACERCWRDSRWAENFGDGAYAKLVAQRNGIIDDRCTPEEQAGPDATECPACKRKTVHQHTHLCQTPGCKLGEYLADKAAI
jgi:hypothetical protein